MRRIVRPAALRGAGALAAASAAVLLMAPAAVAATGIDITRQSDGSAVSTTTPVDRDDVLHVVGHVPAFTTTTQLVVRQPGDAQAHPVGSVSTTTSAADLRWDLRTTCVSFGGTCAQALNGQWTVSLTGGYTATRSFTLRIPPAVVQGVSASASQTVVTVTWQPGTEPDLRGYDVLTADDRPLVTGIDAARACGSGGCSATFDMGAGSGGDHQFVVRAERATCPGCDATVASADSQPASVTIHEPTPAPSSGGTSGSGTGATGGSGGTGGAGGSGTGGPSTGTGGASAGATSGHTGGGASARSFDDAFRSYVPGAVVLGAPDLPALRTEVAPLPDGSFKPKLAYPDQVRTEAVREPVHKPMSATFTAGVARIVDNHLLWRSVAAACLLLLVAGHLRAWVTTADDHHS